MTLRSTPLLALSAAAIAAFGLIADPAMAGKGDNGNSGGDRGNSGDRGDRGGKSSSASTKSKSSKTLVTTNSHSGGNGALASELKKANGAIHASDTAWANASANGVPGIARTYAEAQAGIDGLSGDVEQLLLDKEALEAAVSYDVYQAQIDALNPDDYTVEGVLDEEAFNADKAGLEALRDAADPRTSQEIADELGLIEGEIAEYEGYEGDKAAALAALIGDRELSPEAMAELEARVDAYLASDQYLATVETAEPVIVEEVPAE